MTDDRKKVNFITILFKVIKQAIKDGKKNYILWLSFIFISSIITYFSYLYLEKSTNAAFRFANKKNLDFYKEIYPIFCLFLLFSIDLIIGLWINNHRKLVLFRDLNTMHDFRLMEKLSKMTWENYETQNVQAKVSLIRFEGKNSYNSLANGFVNWFIQIITQTCVFLVFICRLNWQIALGFFLLSIIYIYIGAWCGKKIHKNYQDTEIIRKKRTYLYRATKSKEAHQDSLVNRLYDYLTPKWKRMNDIWSNRAIKSDLRRGYYTMLPDLLYALMVCGLLYFTILEVESGTKTIGYAATLIGITISLGANLKSFSNDLAWFVKDAKIFDDYLSLMELETEFENTQKHLENKFDIEFKNVTFTYPQGTHKVLNNCSLKLKSHETIAIVGVNGSGKTTFVNILMELTKKYQGDVFVNNENINNELGILRNSSSCIFQDFLEYSLTIKENIILGDITRSFSDEEILDILEEVSLKDFVMALPLGINTMLGQIEKGIDLSKGQYQRLAICRLLAKKDAKMWILDEPTAYLDPLAEIKMYDFIYELKKNRTVIFISHRLGFAKKADRIIVFKEGKIIEDATHTELINNPESEYSLMYEKQKKWYE